MLRQHIEQLATDRAMGNQKPICLKKRVENEKVSEMQKLIHRVSTLSGGPRIILKTTHWHSDTIHVKQDDLILMHRR